jgi:hypothetical protein
MSNEADLLKSNKLSLQIMLLEEITRVNNDLERDTKLVKQWTSYLK